MADINKIMEEQREILNDPKKLAEARAKMGMAVNVSAGPTAWVCPVCGGGNAPHVSRCPCKPIQAYPPYQPQPYPSHPQPNPQPNPWWHPHPPPWQPTAPQWQPHYHQPAYQVWC